MKSSKSQKIISIQSQNLTDIFYFYGACLHYKTAFLVGKWYLYIKHLSFFHSLYFSFSLPSISWFPLLLSKNSLSPHFLLSLVGGTNQTHNLMPDRQVLMQLS